MADKTTSETLDRGALVLASDKVNIGDRVRRRRLAAGLTLHDVERRTAGEFKASALGAYERGERVLSVPRLLRLAEVLGVSADEILGEEPEINLTALHEAERAERSAPWDEPALMALARFAAHVRTIRHSPIHEPLHVRKSDCEFMAMLFGTDPTTMQQTLVTLGMNVG